MDALTEQFLIEARELTAQAAEDLVALERNPADRARIERLFRAVHTLKGSAGIMELAPMSGLMHAAEEVLETWRSGESQPSADLIDWALESLDLTEVWLDHYETSGHLPPGADEEARSLIARQDGASDRSEPGSAAPPPDWVGAMLARSGQGAPGPLVAIDYAPGPRCFFDGDDPIGLLRRMPGLLALRIEPREPWAPLDAVDPFACNLRLRAIAQGPIAEVQAPFRFVADQVWIGEVDPPQAAGPDPALLAAILAEQVRILETSSGEEAVPGLLDSAARTAAAACRHGGDPERALRIEAAGMTALAAGDPEPLVAALQARPPKDEGAEATAGPGVALRVDPARMDDLANLVGEIIVARNALGFLIVQGEAGMPPADLLRALRVRGAEMERLTTRLQQSVTGLRLLPLAPVFRRFPRLVRETARTLGKKVALVTRGEDTQVDKAVVDMLFEPLLHLVRNALDHAVEPPEERRAAGKPEEGVISMTASLQGERVVIEVTDDGRGMDDAAIRRTAVARGLLSEEAAAALSGPEALRLVLRPGFSTASQVSDLSGRGVGMDVVRAAVEAMGGRLDLSSRPGQGTTCRLDLPVGMSLTRVLVVRVGAERFGLPLDRVGEVLRLPRQAIQDVHGGRAFVLRGRTVPLMALADLLDLPDDGGADEVPTLAVLTAQGLVGLAVDGFEERLDAALRPPEGLLAAMPNLLGTTLRGNGRVLLVLDPEALLG